MDAVACQFVEALLVKGDIRESWWQSAQATVSHALLAPRPPQWMQKCSHRIDLPEINDLHIPRSVLERYLISCPHHVLVCLIIAFYTCPLGPVFCDAIP